jgi:hypothetical protein
VQLRFKRDGDDPLARCKSVTTCAFAALIQIKADQNTAFSDGSEVEKPSARGFPQEPAGSGGYELLSAHLITFSQTLPCFMRIRAIENAKSDMIATTIIAPQI